MSKQSKAKEDQNYVQKAIPQTCNVCGSCVPVMGEVLRYKAPDSCTMGETHLVSEQVSQKCGIGGFAVKKMGTCRWWLPLPDNAVVSGDGSIFFTNLDKLHVAVRSNAEITGLSG